MDNGTKMILGAEINKTFLNLDVIVGINNKFFLQYILKCGHLLHSDKILFNIINYLSVHFGTEELNSKRRITGMKK